MGFRERGHLERLTPERFVYIDLKPDNGGIVLNVSRAGLCVQSVAPVKAHQSFTFSFRDHDAGSHGVGEVVWTDESSKFAGLRFTRVSAEACGEIEQIAKAPPLRSDQDSSPEVALVPVDLQDAVTLSLSSEDIERASPLRIALLREAKRLPKRRLSRWVPRILVIALAICAIWASIALYRYSRPRSPESRAVTEPAPSASVRSAETPSIAPAKPSAEIVAPRNNITSARRTRVLFTSPAERPLITAAPVRFEYPAVAAGSPSGTVDLLLLISATGSIQDVKILSGNHNLANAGMMAARRWRYRPLAIDGRPVEAKAHVKMSFTGDEAVSVSFRE